MWIRTSHHLSCSYLAKCHTKWAISLQRKLACISRTTLPKEHSLYKISMILFASGSVKQPYCILTLSNSWHERLCFVLYLWEGRTKRYKATKKIVKFWWQLYCLAGNLNIQGGQFFLPWVYNQISLQQYQQTWKMDLLKYEISFPVTKITENE
jgi:hypothetical protein